LLYILFGLDEFSLYETLSDIRKSLGDPAMQEINTATLEGQKLTYDELGNLCETVPFMTDKRLVIVRGLLERFDSRGKAANRKAGSQATKQQAEIATFIEVISRVPETTILVMVDETQIKNSNPLLNAITAKGEVRSFPLLKGSRLHQWIQKRVSEEGGTIAPQAVCLMAELVGSNLRLIANEISKLVLYTGGRPISETDVKTVVSFAQESNIFILVDAIIAYKAGVAGQMLKTLLLAGASPSYVLAMLTRQVRLMARTKELMSAGTPEREIQSRLGLFAEFAWKKTLEQVRQNTLQRIRRIYDKLLETDLAIKTGKYDSELAINLLIAELCHKG